ncbi:MAG TPA: hypothetical protein VLA39_02630, partial [Marinobacterium sp.]|nr:hypothetical protein [Marinobacterium sp.]
ALRQRGYTKPIIGLTGATVGMEAKRLLESGADYVLAKPLSIINLEAALKSLDRDGSALMDKTESVVTTGDSVTD